MTWPSVTCGLNVTGNITTALEVLGAISERNYILVVQLLARHAGELDPMVGDTLLLLGMGNTGPILDDSRRLIRQVSYLSRGDVAGALTVAAEEVAVPSWAVNCFISLVSNDMQGSQAYAAAGVSGGGLNGPFAVSVSGALSGGAIATAVRLLATHVARGDAIVGSTLELLRSFESGTMLAEANVSLQLISAHLEGRTRDGLMVATSCSLRSPPPPQPPQPEMTLSGPPPPPPLSEEAARERTSRLIAALTSDASTLQEMAGDFWLTVRLVTLMVQGDVSGAILLAAEEVGVPTWVITTTGHLAGGDVEVAKDALQWGISVGDPVAKAVFDAITTGDTVEACAVLVARIAGGDAVLLSTLNVICKGDAASLVAGCDSGSVFDGMASLGKIIFSMKDKLEASAQVRQTIASLLLLCEA